MDDSLNIPGLEQIKSLPPGQAIECLNAYIEIHPEDDEAYTIRGLKYWALNRRREAINDYLQALRINPSSRAKLALELAHSVLDFYNKDLLNP